MLVHPFLRPLTLRWLVLLSALCSVSCSGSGRLNPVRGQVLYKDQPIKGAVVGFHPQTAADEVSVLRPVGLTADDGTFTLTTGPHEGAPAGEYLVTIVCPEVVPPRSGGGISMGPPDTRDRFQGAYADRQKFKLKVEVKSGPNQLEPFRLK